MKDATRAVRTYPFYVPMNNLMVVEVLEASSGICKLRRGTDELALCEGQDQRLVTN